MQQTLNLKERISAARAKGIFRYHSRTVGHIALWLLGISLISELITVLIPAFISSARYYWSGGLTADLATTFLFLIAGAQIMAGRSTRFLLRFGTPRFSVWLCNLLSLWGMGMLLLVGTFLVSTLLSYLALLLSTHLPQYQLMTDSLFFSPDTSTVFNAAFLNDSFAKALANLPHQLSLLLQWTPIFYFFTCCLRRAKWWTLSVIVGVPFVFILLTLVPAVRQGMAAVANGDSTALNAMGLQWLYWINKISRYLYNEWPTVQLCIAGASLPLSYLCMRGTKQP